MHFKILDYLSTHLLTWLSVGGNKTPLGGSLKKGWSHLFFNNISRSILAWVIWLFLRSVTLKLISKHLYDKLTGLYNVDTFKSFGSDSFVTHLRHLCLIDSKVKCIKLMLWNIKTHSSACEGKHWIPSMLSDSERHVLIFKRYLLSSKLKLSYSFSKSSFPIKPNGP